MIKTILIANSFSNEEYDNAIAWCFNKGQYRMEGQESESDFFWIECTLPAIPHKGSNIELLNGIEEQDMIDQLTKVFDKCIGFQNFMVDFRNKNKAWLGNITAREAVKYFCGYKYLVDNVYSGNWYVDKVSFRANDEYMYVEMHHEL